MDIKLEIRNWKSNGYLIGNLVILGPIGNQIPNGYRFGNLVFEVVVTPTV
jgi:hypothetical protein